MKGWEESESGVVAREHAGELAGASVLVTGAGGYIGSALAMAIAAARPARLLLLDSSEQNLFAIDQRLKAVDAGRAREAVLGSVLDKGLLDRLFRRCRPQIVFHAAALKHVPLLERNPLAAVRENALGTYTLAQTAIEYQVSRLTLVSTDKAVNPRSIMGVSKRIAELIVAALSTAKCSMNAVRLGNVFGSTGSIVPILRDQIRRGGPVTLTHPEATRYFMTLTQAVEAILAAGNAPCDGRVLLPELGKPKRIVDVARDLIGQDKIGIQLIGLRPGEKLHEDLVYADEVREGRTTGGLEVLGTCGLDPSELHRFMTNLACLLVRGQVPEVLETIRSVAPQYEPSSTVLEAVEESRR